MRVFLNGELLPREEAKVSVFDRGFLFGDGVYEVIPVYGEMLFRFAEHLARLNNSLLAINIENPHTDSEWEQICRAVIRENEQSGDKSVYIQITRGVSERQHIYNDGLRPTVFVMCNSITMNSYDGGVSAIVHADIRWLRCSIKAITLLPNILLRQLAKQSDGSYEAILVRDNKLTEGAASNVFIVIDDRILTPPKSNNILPGITRDLLVELLREAGLPLYEEEIPEQNLYEAEEIWLTGSTTGVAPVLRLDGKTVGTGKPGKWWLEANKLFNNYISDYKRISS